MAQSSFPFQAVDTTETQFSQWDRHIITNGRSSVNGVTKQAWLDRVAEINAAHPYPEKPEA